MKKKMCIKKNLLKANVNGFFTCETSIESCNKDFSWIDDSIGWFNLQQILMHFKEPEGMVNIKSLQGFVSVYWNGFY